MCVFVCVCVFLYIHKIAHGTDISVVKHSFKIFANDQIV